MNNNEYELNKNELAENLPEDQEIANDDVLQDLALKYQAEINDLKDKLLRNVAEIDNTRKRYEKMVEETKEYSITDIAKSLMGVMDNLYRALEHKPNDHNDDELKNFILGVELISSELQNVFVSRNINQVLPQPGEKFDYNYHQAVSQISTKDFEPGTIVNVIQAGYIIKNRLLRPAMVNIATAQNE